MAIRIENEEDEWHLPGMWGKDTSNQPAMVVSPSQPQTVNSSLTVPNRALAEIQAKKAELISLVQGVTVTDQTSFAYAASLRQQIRKVTDTFEALLRPGINRDYKAWKAGLADLEGHVGPLNAADVTIKAQQDRFQSEERKKALEEKRRVDAIREAARNQELAEELARAAKDDSPAAPELVGQVLERMAAPLPEIPIVHTPVKAQGSSAKTVPTFTLLDLTKIDPKWVMKMIQEEITMKGECEWLGKKIMAEVKRYGPGAEEIVGRGSIKYDEVVSTGVRR